MRAIFLPRCRPSLGLAFEDLDLTVIDLDQLAQRRESLVIGGPELEGVEELVAADAEEVAEGHPDPFFAEHRVDLGSEAAAQRPGLAR
jgi:hypothetical protein